MDDDIPYLLLTPGPLTTSRTVRQAMLNDYSTWDIDYNSIVDQIRDSIVRLATDQSDYTCTLMQGSGTFAVEATLGSVIPQAGKILVISNGAYGKRMLQIAKRLEIDHIEVSHSEVEQPNLDRIKRVLSDDRAISHVAMVHCETTTGMLNPIDQVGELVAEFEKTYIVDAMSSFGGFPMTIETIGADFLISSANKCIQGVPGFAFVVAARSAMQRIKGQARSLSLDLYEQWWEMENNAGKWRYTSPTHAVCAFQQALQELTQEGGIAVRHSRYCENHRLLVAGMQRLGLQPLLPADLQSPFITSFLYPSGQWFEFASFYDKMKSRRYVLYPGKVSQAESFRIGTIGHVFPDDITSLVANVGEVLEEMSGGG